jgi:hypothetical protein
MAESYRAGAVPGVVCVEPSRQEPISRGAEPIFTMRPTNAGGLLAALDSVSAGNGRGVEGPKAGIARLERRAQAARNAPRRAFRPPWALKIARERAGQMLSGRHLISVRLEIEVRVDSRSSVARLANGMSLRRSADASDCEVAPTKRGGTKPGAARQAGEVTHEQPCGFHVNRAGGIRRVCTPIADADATEGVADRNAPSKGRPVKQSYEEGVARLQRRNEEPLVIRAGITVSHTARWCRRSASVQHRKRSTSPSRALITGNTHSG